MKKNLIYILCGVVIVAALAIMLIFVFSGNHTADTPTVDLLGTWKVVAYAQNGSLSIVDHEFMVFDETSVKDYRDNADAPFVTSTYTLDDKQMLQLPDIGRQYKVVKVTENYICLYETDTVYLELIRADTVDFNPAKPDPAVIEGKWSLIYRNTDVIYAGDVMQFENGQLSYYQGGSTTPSAHSDYTWDEAGVLTIVLWNKQMKVYPLSNGTLIMVEQSVDTGFVWEFQKVTE